MVSAQAPPLSSVRVPALEDSTRAWATPACRPTPQRAPLPPRVLPRAHLTLAGSCLPKDVVYLQEPLAREQAG